MSYENQGIRDNCENANRRSNISPANEKTARGITMTAGRYETRDEDFDEEGIENPYGDMYINEEITSDISIRELDQVINDKRRNEDEGFKREYAVSIRLR